MAGPETTERPWHQWVNNHAPVDDPAHGLCGLWLGDRECGLTKQQHEPGMTRSRSSDDYLLDGERPVRYPAIDTAQEDAKP